jgi:tRNA pseudouridine38-40 synthase
VESTSLRNVRLRIAYDGTDYVGWQVQPNGTSVQAVLLEAIRRLTGEQATLFAAGRTDSGVHALGQVANFRTNSTIPADQIRRGLQNYLPDDVVVRHVDEVPEDFHATYDAIRKRYRYVIRNTRVKDPFTRRFAWHFWGDLDVAAMQSAADVLLGTHDFRCFESQWPNKATSVRTIEEVVVRRCAEWDVWDEGRGSRVEGKSDGADSASSPGPWTLDPRPYVTFDIVADGFLYNMVRAIMGTLIKVGRGTWNADDVRRIVEQGDRGQAGETAPPQGLFLVKVDYGEGERGARAPCSVEDA